MVKTFLKNSDKKKQKVTTKPEIIYYLIQEKKWQNWIN